MIKRVASGLARAEQLETTLKDGDVITILPAITGG
ncbi:MAG: MoaD/ThiS family protein [Candidatus Brockarchaeota archaeon]|nr:MoaD/ThiS family protein [Candidatus Brockarchaeota archaeon]